MDKLKERKDWIDRVLNTIKKVIFILILCILLPALITELYLRYIGLGDPIRYSSDYVYGYAPKENQKKSRIKNAEVTINDVGLRSLFDWKNSKEEKILFMATAFSVEDAKQIDPYVKIHKIASYEINHTRLLEFISQTKKPILISTGAASYDEIDFAVNKIKKNGNKNIGILQCTAKYPASIELLNLSVIPEMNSKYNLPVGLSDHSIDPIIGPLMSIGLGGKFIEKHFTLDKKLDGPDHYFALEPNELKLMVKTIRDGEKSKGNKNKKILKEEKDLKIFATRSIQAIKNIKKGDTLEEGVNFEVLRPGKRIRGVDARFLEKVNGKKAIKNISKGNGIKQFK